MPSLLLWLLAVAVVWAAAMLWYRSAGRRPDREGLRRRRKAVSPLRPGESYDAAVKLTTAPNAPIAESICVHLRANGIEAFSKGTSQLGALMRIASDLGPTEVWVASHDLERAQALLGREGSTT